MGAGEPGGVDVGELSRRNEKGFHGFGFGLPHVRAVGFGAMAKSERIALDNPLEFRMPSPIQRTSSGPSPRCSTPPLQVGHGERSALPCDRLERPWKSAPRRWVWRCSYSRSHRVACGSQALDVLAG